MNTSVSKKGGGVIAWILGIAGALATAGIVGNIGFAVHTSKVDATQTTVIGEHERRIGGVEIKQDELQKQVTEVVTKGVEAGVSQSLQNILRAIEENRSGAHTPARDDTNDKRQQ